MLQFFRRVHSVLTRGGVFVLEPQAWDTYAKAKRIDEVRLTSILNVYHIDTEILQSLKENAKNLKLRPDKFESILCDIGFGPAQHLGTTGEGGQ